MDPLNAYIWCNVLDGDNTLRTDYPLNYNSVVFDAGGYIGEWSEKIINKYGCYIYIFEPIKEYYNICLDKFKANDKIKIFNFGLSNDSYETLININEDASSVNIKGSNTEKISLVRFSDFIKQHKINHIDLLKINIEGEEYNLLQNIIDSKSINKIDNIQIQFHNFINNAKQLRKDIQNKLKKTHILTYNYNFLWENWQLKEMNIYNNFENIKKHNNKLFYYIKSLLLKNNKLEDKINKLTNHIYNLKVNKNKMLANHNQNIADHIQQEQLLKANYNQIIENLNQEIKVLKIS